MQFQRLRLSGFKSFVETTEFRIEPGLTAVVGPNGCGKSNLLEALRWVMGANSAKAMRAGGMDDVIFAGAGARASCNHAEVTLTIDNSDRTAPAAFNADPVIEVVRRIDRGEGSSYRINGRDARARDVQLLFADASTGANSPALVRQGQISELIAAKPQNRRRILEEAGGVSGLHTRRHEAELRLRAAEANLDRLDDVARELDTALARLKRKSRQAEAYKRLSAEIRNLQAALLFARWSEARLSQEQCDRETQASTQRVEDTARSAATASTELADAETALPGLRDNAAIAAAVLGRLAIEKDRLERDVEGAARTVERLRAEIARIADDDRRESQMAEDSQAALARYAKDIAAIEDQIAAAPQREPQLRAAAEAAEQARVQADSAVEQLATAGAAHDAEHRAALTRRDDAKLRLDRAQRALDQAVRDRTALGGGQSAQISDARVRVEQAQAAAIAARDALEAAELQWSAAAQAEIDARNAARQLEDQLGRLKTEARGLAQLTAPGRKGAFPPVLDQVSPARGHEAALAAALGDDLDAALDPRAAAYWAGADHASPRWPDGAVPLAPAIAAPPELAARLAYTALVGREDGERLQAKLEPGCRLVSLEGDLWRWDGLIVRADAPKAAAVRLEQKARLAEVETEIERLAPQAKATLQAHGEAQSVLRQAEATVKAARTGPPAADKALGLARDALDQLSREDTRREARAQSLDETIARFQAEHQEAVQALASMETALASIVPLEGLAEDLAKARLSANQARETAAQTCLAQEADARERYGRARRLETLTQEQADWTRRAETTLRRREALERQRQTSIAALDEARDLPAAAQARLAGLIDQFAMAEQRQTVSVEALTAAETARTAADRRLRASETAASEAREQRAAANERLEAARERLATLTETIRDQAKVEPEALGERLAHDAIAIPSEARGVEAHLANLERERDNLGPVNLRADEEVVDYSGRVDALYKERTDLVTAIAKLRGGIEALNVEGRGRLLAAFDVINGHFQSLFTTLFGGGEAELRLVESEDPLEAGLEIYACPPGKRLATMSLMSGGEQALTATALIFGVFLANPAPICVLDEVDAPLDDANVDRFCTLLEEMRRRTQTRFITITHNPVTMSRMDRLFGVTMAEPGVSQLVSVDLRQAEALVAQ